MNLQQQKDIITLYNQYNNTLKHNRAVIKSNLKHYMDNSQHKINELAQLTGIAVHSLYQMRKDYTHYCPEFIPALILCDCLEISIIEILKPLKEV